MTTIRPNKLERTVWLNTATEPPTAMYGIRARFPGHGWMNMAENGVPLIYANTKDRDTKLRQLRKTLREEKITFFETNKLQAK